jgi:hypothetical protein
MAKRRTDNTMAKRRTDNTMAKRRTDNTMAKRRTDNRTNHDLQNIAHKTKDRVTRTPLKTGDELRCSGRVGSKIPPKINLLLCHGIPYLSICCCEYV